MKRTPFKRKSTPAPFLTKPRKGLKRGRLKKVSKQSISKLQRILWELCKQITRHRYRKKDGTWCCFTCGRVIDEAWKAQTGHGIPKASLGAYLKYDLRILRVQDYWCNINLGGNGAEFYRKLVEELGQEEVDKIYQDRQKTVKAYDHYQSLITQYQKELQSLTNTKS